MASCILRPVSTLSTIGAPRDLLDGVNTWESTPAHTTTMAPERRSHEEVRQAEHQGQDEDTNTGTTEHERQKGEGPGGSTRQGEKEHTRTRDWRQER